MSKINLFAHVSKMVTVQLSLSLLTPTSLKSMYSLRVIETLPRQLPSRVESVYNLSRLDYGPSYGLVWSRHGYNVFVALLGTPFQTRYDTVMLKWLTERSQKMT